MTVTRCGVGKSALLENQPGAIAIRIKPRSDFGLGATLTVHNPSKRETDQGWPFNFEDCAALGKHCAVRRSHGDGPCVAGCEGPGLNARPEGPACIIFWSPPLCHLFRMRPKIEAHLRCMIDTTFKFEVSGHWFRLSCFRAGSRHVRRSGQACLPRSAHSPSASLQSS